MSKAMAWVLNSSADVVTGTSRVVNSTISEVGKAATDAITTSTQTAASALPDEPILPLPKTATSGLAAAAGLVRTGTSLTKTILGAAGAVGGEAGRVVGSSVVSGVSALGRSAGMGGGKTEWVDPELSAAAQRLLLSSSDAVTSVLDSTEQASAAVVDASVGSISHLVGKSLGPEAGDVVRSNLTLINDAVKTAYKVKSFGVRKMASSSAKSFRKQALRSVLVLNPPDAVDNVAKENDTVMGEDREALDRNDQSIVIVPLMTVSNYSHSKPSL